MQSLNFVLVAMIILVAIVVLVVLVATPWLHVYYNNYLLNYWLHAMMVMLQVATIALVVLVACSCMVAIELDGCSYQAKCTWLQWLTDCTGCITDCMY